MEDVLLTREGFAQLTAELEHLSTVRRLEIAERIRLALEEEGGDLSANGEYIDAREEQAHLEHRIATLAGQLAHARVVDEASLPGDAVVVGSHVRLEDVETGEAAVYRLVGPAEADPWARRLSYKSPVGEGILGGRKGETVAVAAPQGMVRFRILEIEAA